MDDEKPHENTSVSDEDLVREIASLARIDFEPGEIEMYAAQMRSILNHFEDLKEIDVEGIDPTVQIRPIELPTGVDEIEPGLPIESSLRMSLRRRGDLLSVPRIVNPDDEGATGA